MSKPDQCPNCTSTDFVKNGRRYFKEHYYQRYKCKNCGFRFTAHTRRLRNRAYFRMKAAQLYIEGLSYHAIANLLEMTDWAIKTWLEPHLEALDELRLDRHKLKVQKLRMGK